MPKETAPPAKERAHPLRAVGSLSLVLVCGAVVLFASARVGPLASTPPVASASAATSAPPPEVMPSATSSAPAISGDAEATCNIPDRGAGVWPSDFTKLPLGRMLVPNPAPVDDYDILLHLHGGEAARKVAAPLERRDLVMVAVDAGVGSQAYAEALAGIDALPTILSAVDAALKPARLRQLVVSSWSAGYGGVRTLLTHNPTSIGALVMLDSIHTSYQPDGESLVTDGLDVFRAYAKRAVAGEAKMIVTHSEIRPPGYASTSEVASWLLTELGGRREYAGLDDAHGVAFKTRYDDGGFSVRGFTGRGKPAHCAHVMMLRDILRDDVFARGD